MIGLSNEQAACTKVLGLISQEIQKYFRLSIQNCFLNFNLLSLGAESFYKS
jgi:hypothetical protein